MNTEVKVLTKNLKTFKFPKVILDEKLMLLGYDN